MRGFPPLHVIAFTLAFALLAIPLSHLTFARPDTGAKAVEGATAPAEPTTNLVPVLVRVRMAHVPTSLSLKFDGSQEILPPELQKPSSGTIEFRTKLTLPKQARDGIEIFATAAWPAGTPDTAITLDLEPEAEMESKSFTQWTSGSPELSAPFKYSW